MAEEKQYDIDVQIQDKLWNEGILDIADLCVATCSVVLSAMNISDCSHKVYISIVLCDDNLIQTLNRQYRGKDKPTNVLSFPTVFLDPEKLDELSRDTDELQRPFFIGDIILARQTIERESIEQKKTLEDHLVHMLVHSTLHLLGYDHNEEEKRLTMEKKEISILKKLGVTDPYVL